MPGGELKEKVKGFYARFYQGEGLLGLVSRDLIKRELIGAGYYPEAPAKPTKYSTYTYFADMGKALARVVSIFYNQKAIGPPPRATRQPTTGAIKDDDSSDDDQPTQRSRRPTHKRSSTRTGSESDR